jgi:hypothetical protein
MSIACNVGTTDRLVRGLAGALMIVLAFAGVVGGTLGIVVGVAGGVFLVTAVVRFCPIYQALGWSTCAPALRTR